MNNFMGQFKHLSPGLLFKFDTFLYTLGVRMLGRTSGLWSSVKVGEVWALRLGDNDSVTKGRDPNTVRFESMMGTVVETDPLTASVAFTALAVNWFWNQNADIMSDEANEDFERVHFGLSAGVWSDNPTVKLNTSDYHDLTD